MKLKRLADTQTDTTVDLADASLGIQKEQLPSVANEEDAVEKALIPHEIFTRSWRSSLVKELSDTGLRFPESLLKVIGGLNNCRVELETDGATITARAENMQDVEKAIAKVKSIDDWAVSSVVRRFAVFHLTLLVPTINISTLVRFLLCRRRA